MTDRPILFGDETRIRRLHETLAGARFESVRYVQSRIAGYGSAQNAKCEQVDFDLLLRLSTGSFSVTWSRDDLIEGLHFGDQISTYESPDLVTVDGGDEWSRYYGRVITGVAFGWFDSSGTGPRSLWSIRATTDRGQSVVIALGELDSASRPTYHPDSLVVIFDESQARQYVVTDTSGSAWGSEYM